MKKVTRKQIAEMSATDFVDAAKAPYRRLLRHLRPYLGRFFLGVLFSILFGLSNFALVFGMRWVFSWVLPGSVPMEPPTFLERFGIDIDFASIDAPDASSGLTGILVACFFVPGLMLVRGLFSYLSAYCMMWVGIRVLEDIRTQLFSHMLEQSLEFYNKSKAGDLIQTVFNQTRMAQMALTSVLGDVLKGPVSIIGILVGLFVIDWKFTLAATVVFPLCLIPVIAVSNKVRKAGAKEEEEAGMLMVVMQEAFAGIRVVKSYAREDYERKRFNAANDKMLRFIMRWRKALEIVGPLVETVASFGIAAALFYAWRYDMPAQDFMTLVIGLVALYPHAKGLSKIPVLLQKCLAATTKVFHLMDREPDIRDKPDAIALKQCEGDIRFEEVSFSYKKDIQALKGVSLHIEKGLTYALVGPSGAGKSTMFSLLLRFYDPQGGRILLDGHDLRDLQQHTLRDQIGIVNQETFLFHDTIYNNILYGRPDASKKEVHEAARKAFAHDFILAQENGYDTVVGDKGCMLSGGQQQRISIARAILRNAPILLLDEATSALDTESERQIQAALETLSQGKTVIAIAHRLSTILKADRIVVMEGGEVLDVGSHAELIERSPLYQRLYNLQFSHPEGELAAAAQPM